MEDHATAHAILGEHPDEFGFMFLIIIANPKAGPALFLNFSFVDIVIFVNDDSISLFFLWLHLNLLWFKSIIVKSVTDIQSFD